MLFWGRICSYPQPVSGAAVPSLGMHPVPVAGREQRGNEDNRNSPAWQVVGLDKIGTGLWAAVKCRVILGLLVCMLNFQYFVCFSPLQTMKSRAGKDTPRAGSAE